MNIKVKDIKQHYTQYATGCDDKFEVPVVEGKLVLITNTNADGSVKRPYNINHNIPIIISETEKIEVGDTVNHGLINELIYIVDKDNLEASIYNKSKKILVLPEQFSPEQLQMIVDGKIKDGDKVLIECVDNTYIHEGSGKYWEDEPAEMKRILGLPDKYIKLNSQGHITLYEVEDNPNSYNLEVGKQYWFQYTGCKSEWFNGIVTRFTKFGHPWVQASSGYTHNGIISPGLYNVQSMTPKAEEKMYTREELREIVNSYIITFSTDAANGAFRNILLNQAKEWFEQNVK